jgi:signal transduction histidine kinase
MLQRLHTRDETRCIGLAVVKKIIERHGGRIGVRSKQGEGSTFIFALPMTPPASPEGSAP